MKYLKHYGFAGAVWNVWEYRDGMMHLIFEMPKGPPLHVAIPVCSEAHPVEGAFLISRRTEGWQLSPAAIVTDGYAVRASVHPDVDADFMLLTGAPPETDEALSRC